VDLVDLAHKLYVFCAHWCRSLVDAGSAQVEQLALMGQGKFVAPNVCGMLKKLLLPLGNPIRMNLV